VRHPPIFEQLFRKNPTSAMLILEFRLRDPEPRVAYVPPPPKAAAVACLHRKIRNCGDIQCVKHSKLRAQR